MKKNSNKTCLFVIFIFILITIGNLSNAASQKVKENGIYKLAIGKDESKVIEIKSDSTNNNVNADICNYEEKNYQKFYIEYQKDGFYKITAMHSGKSLTVKDGMIKEGTEIVQYEYQGLDSQKWILRDSNKNGWIISPLNNTKLAITVNGSIQNRSKLILSETKDNNNQMLYIYNISNKEQKHSNGTYKLAVGKISSKVIQIKDGNQSNNAIADISEYKELTQQKFYFEYQNEGFYKITAVHSNKSLTIKDANITAGTEIVQYEYQGLNSQKWILRDSNKNGWIISPLNNPRLAITVNGSIQNSSKLVLNETKDNDNQMFYIYKISEQIENEQKQYTINPNEYKHTDGIYKFAIGKDSSKVIEVKDKLNNGLIIVKQYENLESQKFYLDYQEEGGYYKITAMYTGKTLTIKDNKIQQNSEIVQYEYQGLESQKWILRDSNKNGWIISPLSNPNLALTIDGTIKNGSKLILSKTQDNDNQMLYVFNITKENQKFSNGIYKLAIGKDSNKVVEVKGTDRSDNVIVDLYEYKGEEQQKFYLDYQEEGYYKITVMNTGKSLTVKNNKIQQGSEIVQYNYQELESQKWILRDSNKNGWIVSPLSNQSLALTIDGTIKNGSKLILSKTQDNDNQMLYVFNITKENKKFSNGIYKLAIGKDSSKVMEVKGADKSDNALMDLYTYKGEEQQKFYLEYQEEGFYKITVMHTGKSLTVKENLIKEGNNITQYNYKALDSQKWILRDSNKNGWILSPLSNPNLALTIDGQIKNGSKLILRNTQDSDNQMFYVFKLLSTVNIDTNKYPGIIEKIEELSIKHPNWDFEILYTTLDFNTAVQKEYEYANKQGNLVYTPTYKGDWIAPNPYVSGNWASASYNGIAYFMDSRNFLNEVDIFQFIDLSDYASSGVTLNSVQYQVNGTFLENYAQDIMTACNNVNINPYYTIARLFQEQGKKGSSTIYMDGKDGNLYFNPFNIGAQVGNDYQTALARAKKEGWNSMQKGIEGGIKILKSYYIDKKQNTLYLNKFDVNPASGGGFYNHQYMQNLSAAYSEARILNGAYVESKVLDNNIKFIIPLYENMPKNVSEKPTGLNTVQYDKNVINNNDRVKVSTNDGSGVNIRSGPGTSYAKIRSASDGTTGTRIVTGINFSDGLWWDEVIFDDGTRGFVVTNYLKKI